MSTEPPDLPDHSERRQRAEQIRVFRDELERLRRAGALSLDEAQQQALAAYHRLLLAGDANRCDSDHERHDRQLSLGMRIASFLGALALAASVFFHFHQFRGLFAETAQVAILIASALASLGLTAALQQRDRSAYFCKLAALLSFACSVLNLSLLAQIYKVTPSDRVLLPWAGLALLLAYACDLRLLLVGILCLIGFLAARAGIWGGVYWLYAGQRPENFFVAAALLLAVPRLVDHRTTPALPPPTACAACSPSSFRCRSSPIGAGAAISKRGSKPSSCCRNEPVVPARRGARQPWNRPQRRCGPSLITMEIFPSASIAPLVPNSV